VHRSRQQPASSPSRLQSATDHTDPAPGVTDCGAVSRGWTASLRRRRDVPNDSCPQLIHSPISASCNRERARPLPPMRRSGPPEYRAVPWPGCRHRTPIARGRSCPTSIMSERSEGASRTSGRVADFRAHGLPTNALILPVTYRQHTDGRTAFALLRHHAPAPDGPRRTVRAGLVTMLMRPRARSAIPLTTAEVARRLGWWCCRWPLDPCTIRAQDSSIQGGIRTNGVDWLD